MTISLSRCESVEPMLDQRLRLLGLRVRRDVSFGRQRVAQESRNENPANNSSATTRR
jgi:hypothetical protein